MNEITTTARVTLPDVRAALQRMLDKEADHAVFKRLELVYDLADTLESVSVRIGEQVLRVHPEQVADMHMKRTAEIHKEQQDPFNFGYEPPMWDMVDWLIIELRVQFPTEVIEVCIFGGNRAGKTDYASKRMIEALDQRDECLVWCMHTEESSSIAVQQKRVWHYMPLHHKPAEGKLKTRMNQRMNYNRDTGFTMNSFALPNGSICKFKFYSGSADALEGDEPDTVWSDERIPKDWIKALGIRLMTKAGQVGVLLTQMKDALERRKRGELVRVPRALRGVMWRGVHLVTFTPLDGMTPAVSMFVKEAQTRVAEPAPQLPITGKSNELIGHEMMPRVAVVPGSPVAAAWFWNSDNKHGGNHEGMVKKAAKEHWTFAEKKIKLYGYTEKTRGSLFPRFNVDVHVKPLAALPRTGTWYHVVDPCNGRNWFMLWALVASDGTVWCVQEWPPVKDYVPGVGSMGDWVVDSSGKKFDGDKGPAQNALGWGCRRYRDEILRVEGELWKLQHPDASAEAAEGQRIEPHLRIMDSRYMKTPNATDGGTVTIMELMQALDMLFTPSGQTISGDGENKSRVNEGWQVINDYLDFDHELATRNECGVLVPDPAAAPRLIVTDACKNLLWVLHNYTGQDGQHGAGKDPADVLRYLLIAGPEYFPPESLRGTGGLAR